MPPAIGIDKMAIGIFAPEPSRCLLHRQTQIDAQIQFRRRHHHLLHPPEVILAFAAPVSRPMLLNLYHIEAIVFQQRQIAQDAVQIQARLAVDMRAKGEKAAAKNRLQAHRSLLDRAELDARDEIALQKRID